MALVIRFRGGPRAGEVLRFGDEVETILIGRDPDKCQVVFPPEETKVGREHCGLTRRLGRYRVMTNRDNPVLIDGRPAIDDQELGGRVEMQIGRGGPVIVVESDRSGPMLQTEEQSRQPGVATMVRGAEQSARRGGRLALLAMLLLAVAAGIGYYAWRESRQRFDRIETLSESQQESVTRLTTKVASVQDQVQEELAPRLGEVLAEARASVYLVLIKDPQYLPTETPADAPDGSAGDTPATDGFDERAGGTAWVFDQERGILGTNAHVAEQLEEAQANGGEMWVRSSEEPPRDFRVERVELHPGYKAFEELWWNDYEPTARGSAPSLSTISSPGACDVALLYVTDPKGLAPALPVADDEELHSMHPGYPVGYVGFPVESMVLSGVTLQRPTPTTHMAYVTAVTDYFGISTGPAEDRLLVQHSLPSAGGASGSPILNERGQVIALHNASNLLYVPVVDQAQPSGFSAARIGTGVGVNFGQRADLLRELAGDPAEIPDRTAAWRQDMDRYYVRREVVEQRLYYEEALTLAQNEWSGTVLRGRLGRLSIVEEPSFSGTLPSESDADDVAQHTFTVKQPGPHLIVVIGEEGTRLGFQVAQVNKGELLGRYEGAGQYRWLVAAAMEVGTNVELSIDVHGNRPGTQYTVRIYRAEIDPASAPELVSDVVTVWEPWVEGVLQSPATVELIEDVSDSVQPLGSYFVARYDLRAARGQYLVVAVGANGDDIDFAVMRDPLPGEAGEQELASNRDYGPVAAVPFEVTVAGEYHLLVTGPAAGAPFLLRLYRAVPAGANAGP
jgi:hypothetical protein